jgi:hypothetical protein
VSRLNDSRFGISGSIRFDRSENSLLPLVKSPENCFYSSGKISACPSPKPFRPAYCTNHFLLWMEQAFTEQS